MGSELGGRGALGLGERPRCKAGRRWRKREVVAGGLGSRDALGKGRREMQQELCLGRGPAHLQCGLGVGTAPQQSWLSPAPLSKEEVSELGKSSCTWNTSCKAFGGRVGLLEREGDGAKMGFVSLDKEAVKLCRGSGRWGTAPRVQGLAERVAAAFGSGLCCEADPLPRGMEEMAGTGKWPEFGWGVLETGGWV